MKKLDYLVYFRLIESMKYTVFFNETIDGFLVKPSEKEKLIEELKDKKLYIYEKTLSKDYIGIGHARYGREFTVDLDVVPDNVHIESFNKFKDMLNKIDVFPTDDDKEIIKIEKEIAKKMVEKKISLRRTLVTRHFDKYAERRKKVGKELLTAHNEACDSVRTARKLCMEVKELCKKYNANFYFVTDGASCTMNNGNPAVRVAREAVAKWESENGYDEKEDWRDNPDDMTNYRKKKKK